MKPRIPEPMVFDLVRPLGAARGELEVNSLFRLPVAREGPLLWAPEVEYTFADGYGIEFELPLRNGSIESYKGAIQATLPGPWPRKLIQGVQVIGEVAPSYGSHHVDALYLLGVRWSRRWSTFSMTGARRESGDSVGFAVLANHSVFYQWRREVVLGMEANWKGAAVEPRSLLLMPQLHWRRSRINVQAGAGVAHQPGRTSAMLSWRVSREF